MIVSPGVADRWEAGSVGVALRRQSIDRRRSSWRGPPDERYRLVMVASARTLHMEHLHSRRNAEAHPIELVHVAVPAPFADDASEEPPSSRSLPGTRPILRLINGDASVEPADARPRLAVILAADTVGYTQRMAVDEAGMHTSCMTVHRHIIEPQIAHHGARIVKHTGDGFLAEFPSATGAVWFALCLQAQKFMSMGRLETN